MDGITAVRMALEKKVSELETDGKRYRTVRRLNPKQFAELYRHNIETGTPFDMLVDELGESSNNQAEPPPPAVGSSES